MASVTLENVSKVYKGGVRAVKNFNLEIKDKEFVVFVGPSGCGKSTTLRMIAGLEDITAGTIKIGDRVVNDVEPKDRDIAMVFQNYALYPHMTVYENMAFGLVTRHLPKSTIDLRIKEAAKILDITEYLQRKPKNLSGGQRQRVALGRAIVRNPKVFLLDEPLSNLDAKLRVQMRAEISKLHRRLGTTFIYVTHDQTEAMTMGTRIVVMKDGVVQQVDTPSNLFDHPVNTFVATFLGSPQMNILEGRLIKEGDSRTVVFGNPDQPAKVKLPEHRVSILPDELSDDQEVLVGVRPEDFVLDETNGSNLKVTVELMEKLGNETMIYFTIPGLSLTATCRISARTSVCQGDTIALTVNPERIHLFDRASTVSLFKARESNYVDAVFKKDRVIVGDQIVEGESLVQRQIGDLTKTKKLSFSPDDVVIEPQKDAFALKISIDYTLRESDLVAVFGRDESGRKFTVHLAKEPEGKTLTVYVPLSNTFALDENDRKLSTVMVHEKVTRAEMRKIGNDICYQIPDQERPKDEYAHIIDMESINGEVLLKIQTAKDGTSFYIKAPADDDLYIGRLIILLKNKKPR